MFRDRIVTSEDRVSMSQATAIPKNGEKGFGGTRLLVGYLVVTAFLVVAMFVSISIGSDRSAEPTIGGFYSSSSSCLGKDFKLQQSGQFIDLSGSSTGELRLQSGNLHGTANCAEGGTAEVDLALSGEGADAAFSGTVGSEHVTAEFVEPLPEPGASTEARQALERGDLRPADARDRSGASSPRGSSGPLIARVHQPRVMGEVLAGILLGPTLLGAVWPARARTTSSRRTSCR